MLRDIKVANHTLPKSTSCPSISFPQNNTRFEAPAASHEPRLFRLCNPDRYASRYDLGSRSIRDTSQLDHDFL
jgi:hypothetical protein